MPFQVNFMKCHVELRAKMTEKYKSDVKTRKLNREQLKWLHDKINELYGYTNYHNEKKKVRDYNALEWMMGNFHRI